MEGCNYLDIAIDEEIQTINIYYNQFIHALRLTFNNGKRVSLGSKQSADRTFTWDFTQDEYELVGLAGTTVDGRLLTI